MIERIARILATEVSSCERIGSSPTVTHWRVAAGGRGYFVKSGSKENAEEALGLAALAKAGARTPNVRYADGDLLIMDWIETEIPMPAYWADLGRELAQMHQAPQSSFGFETDNHLGGTPQTNSMSGGSWAHYFWTNRLAPLIRRTAWDAPGLRERTLDMLSDVTESPSLVHGDLWSGNVLCGPHQRAYLIDPAPYRGHREVDLAMTELFGGFEPKFYAAYDEVYPRAPGYDQRKLLYNLYHLLNHWILFGLKYRIACESALAELRRA